MQFAEIIQMAASSLVVVTTFLYLVGGLIVNLHLGKYKITEYQIISAHYLVVGIVFVWNMSGTFLIAFLIAFPLSLIAVVTDQQRWAMPLAILAVLGIIATVVLLSPQPTGMSAISKAIRTLKKYPKIWGVVVLLYPFSVLVRSLAPTFFIKVEQWESFIAYTVFGIALGTLTYDYAWRIYGALIRDDADQKGGGIGRGATRRIQLLGKREDIESFAQLGIPLKSSELTDVIYLLAETSSHYIVTCRLDEAGEAIKIRKEIVDALWHKGEPQTENTDGLT